VSVVQLLMLKYLSQYISSYPGQLSPAMQSAIKGMSSHAMGLPAY